MLTRYTGHIAYWWFPEVKIQCEICGKSVIQKRLLLIHCLMHDNTQEHMCMFFFNIKQQNVTLIRVIWWVNVDTEMIGLVSTNKNLLIDPIITIFNNYLNSVPR